VQVHGPGWRFPDVKTRLVLLVVASALAAPSAHAAAPAPYGTNDAGGFRNVLPAGEAGVANVFQLAQFEADGSRPPHWDDQEPLYDGLLYASPNLTAADVPSTSRTRPSV
jgi:hypothetical protein